MVATVLTDPKTLVGGLLVLAMLGCAGPLPLQRAIRVEDEQAYTQGLGRFDASAKEAFLRWRAGQKKIDIADALAADLKLDENPFSARDDAAVSLGAIVYIKHCADCHGADADGEGPLGLDEHAPKDFRSLGARLALSLGPSQRWYWKVRDGEGPLVRYPDGEKRAMPAFGDELSNEQIWLALTYLASSRGAADE